MDFDKIEGLTDKEIVNLYSDTVEEGFLTSYCLCGTTQAKWNSLPNSSRNCGWGHRGGVADLCMASWNPTGAECSYLCARMGLTCYYADCNGNSGYWTNHQSYGWCQNILNGYCITR